MYIFQFSVCYVFMDLHEKFVFDFVLGTGRRYGEMSSNAAKLFNNWIREARHHPIMQLVDANRGQTMEQMLKRQVKGNKWVGQLCPKMEKKVEAEYKTSRPWIVSQADENVYEVHSNPSVLVDVNRRTGSCC